MTNLPPELRDNLGFLLVQAFKKVGKIADKFPLVDEFRLFHLAIMQCVAHSPSTAQQAVSERLLIDPSDVTRHVKQLVNAGFLERRRSDTDARAFELTVTSAGAEWLAQRRKRAVKMYPSFAGLLTADEHSQLRVLLRTLIDNSTRLTGE